MDLSLEYYVRGRLTLFSITLFKFLVHPGATYLTGITPKLIFSPKYLKLTL